MGVSQKTYVEGGWAMGVSHKTYVEGGWAMGVSQKTYVEGVPKDILRVGRE